MIHRVSVGSVDVVVLNVGVAERTAEQLHQIFPSVPLEEIQLQVPNVTRWSFSPLLVHADDHTILVDTGFSIGSDGPMVATAEALAEAGVDPEEVTIVLITHAHGDHIGGLLRDERPAFPNADLYITNVERDSVVQESANRALAAYGERVIGVAPSAEVVSAGGTSIRLVPAPGHTPGHSAVRISSDGEELTALVDTLHSEIQFAHPEWSPSFDADSTLSVATRQRLLGWAADSGARVHFFHLGFPGLGRVERAGDSFAWVPEGAGR